MDKYKNANNRSQIDKKAKQTFSAQQRVRMGDN